MWLDGFRTGWTDTWVGVKLCILCCLPPTQSNFHKQHRGQTSEKKVGTLLDRGAHQVRETVERSNWRQKQKITERWRQNLSLEWKSRLGWLMSCFDKDRDGSRRSTLKSFSGYKAALPVRTRNHLPSDAGDGWQRNRNIHDLWPSTRHLLLYREQALFSGCSWCHGWLHPVNLTFVCQLTIKPTVGRQN